MKNECQLSGQSTKYSGKFQDEDPIFKKLQSSRAMFPEEPTEYWLHINNYLIYKRKGAIVKHILELLGWTVKLLSLVQNLLEIFICQGTLRVSKEMLFSN